MRYILHTYNVCVSCYKIITLYGSIEITNMGPSTYTHLYIPPQSKDNKSQPLVLYRWSKGNVLSLETLKFILNKEEKCYVIFIWHSCHDCIYTYVCMKRLSEVKVVTYKRQTSSSSLNFLRWIIFFVFFAAEQLYGLEISVRYTSLMFTSKVLYHRLDTYKEAWARPSSRGVVKYKALWFICPRPGPVTPLTVNHKWIAETHAVYECLCRL